MRKRKTGEKEREKESKKQRKRFHIGKRALIISNSVALSTWTFFFPMIDLIFSHDCGRPATMSLFY